MNDNEKQAAADVKHAEPQQGGSFTRDLNTGELVSNKPVPADQTEQE